MQPARSRLFTFAWIASLIFFVGLSLMFLRSFWRFDRLGWWLTTPGANGWVGNVSEFVSVGGELALEQMHADWLPGRQPAAQFRNIAHGPAWSASAIDPTSRYPRIDRRPGWLARAGFAIVRQVGSNADFTYSSTDLVAPYWIALLITSLLPALRALRLFRDRRRGNPGLCPTCGYDLRATRARCPECGTAVPASQTVACDPGASWITAGDVRMPP